MLPLSRVSTFREGLDHPECVAVHPDGSVWAGGEAGQVYRISPDGKRMREVANTGGFVLGLAFSPDARHLAICDVKKAAVLRLDLRAKRLSRFFRPRTPISIPNHLAYDRAGRLYVTDSGAFRKVCGRIFRFDADGRGSVWHAGPFNFANGIALAPDGSAVYVVCSWLPGVERIPIRPDGSAGARKVYARTPGIPDGLAFDAKGSLYVSCYTPARIYRVTPAGKVGVHLEDPEAHALSNPTNIAFRGRDLFAANLGRWHVARIRMDVAGAPLACRP